MKRTEQKQRDIVQAAVDEFRLHGFEGARITRVAESAGVSSRTLYKHFPSKESLYLELQSVCAKEGIAAAQALNQFEPGARTLALIDNS